VKRARAAALVPIDPRNAQEKLFNTLLVDLVASAELRDAPLVRRYASALEQMYADALRKCA